MKKIIKDLEKFAEFYKGERDEALDKGDYERAFYYQNSLHSIYHLIEEIKKETRKFIQEKTSKSDDETMIYLMGLLYD